MNRKNLLITTIGEFNCISSWMVENRDFDIALIYYPDSLDQKRKAILQNHADFVFHQPGYKYEAIQKVLRANPHLLNYQNFWMPDDDIKIIKGTTSALFHYHEAFNLDISQPSTLKKNTSWKMLRHHIGYKVRISNFVEVMCPLFSHQALTACLDSFSVSKSGWGLDFLWPTLVKGNIGIIDKVIVEHTKSINLEEGSLYKKLLADTGKTPHDELNEILNKYNLEEKPEILDTIYDDNLIGKLRKLLSTIF